MRRAVLSSITNDVAYDSERIDYCQARKYACLPVTHKSLTMELVSVDDSGQRPNNVRMTHDERVRIGLKLKSLRVEKGLDQAQLAEEKKLDISVGTVQAIENAKYEVKDSNIEKVARFFGTSLRKLLQPDGAIIEPTNPLLKGLNDEHLEVARWYMQARKRTRELIDALMSRGDDARLTNIFLRVEQLPPESWPELEKWIATTKEMGDRPTGESKNTRHTSSK